MKTRSLSISIPEPCHEKWSAMTPNEKGRHCASCQKTVIDFTKLSQTQIIQTVQGNEGSICGRFYANQLNVDLLAPKPSKSWIKYAAIILSLIPAQLTGQNITLPNWIEHYETSADHSDLPIRNLPSTKSEELTIIGKYLDYKNGDPSSFLKIISANNFAEYVPVPINDKGNFETKMLPGSALVVGNFKGKPQFIRYRSLSKSKPILVTLDLDKRVLLKLKKDDHETKEMDDHEELRGEINIKSSEEYRSIVQVPVLESEMKEIISQKNDIVTYDNRSICQYTKGISVEESTNEVEPSYTTITELIDGASYKVYAENTTTSKLMKTEEEDLFTHMAEPVEIVGLSIKTGCHLMGSTVIVTETTDCLAQDEKEGWLKRQWRKFKNLVKKSHKEAQLNRNNKTSIQFSDEEEISFEIAEVKSTNETQRILIVKERPQITLYPNPAAYIINLKSEYSLKDITVNLSNMINEKVFAQNYQILPEQIDVRNLISGAYILSIIKGQELIYSEMVIIQN